MLNSFSLTGYQDNFYFNKANFITKLICLFVFVSLMIFNHELVFHVVILSFTLIILLMTNLSSRVIMKFIINNVIVLLPLFLLISLIFNFNIGALIILKLFIISLYVRIILATTLKKDILKFSIKFFGSYLTWFFYSLMTFSNNFVNELNKIKTGYYLKGINYEEFKLKLKLEFIYYNFMNVLKELKKHNCEIKEQLMSLSFGGSGKINYKIAIVDMIIIFAHLLFLILIVIRG